MYKYRGEISGLMCEKCEARMENAIKSAFHGKHIHFEKRKIVIFLSETSIEESDWRSVVSKAGYQPGILNKEEVKSVFSRLF